MTPIQLIARKWARHCFKEAAEWQTQKPDVEVAILSAINEATEELRKEVQVSNQVMKLSTRHIQNLRQQLDESLEDVALVNKLEEDHIKAHGKPGYREAHNSTITAERKVK